MAAPNGAVTNQQAGHCAVTRAPRSSRTPEDRSTALIKELSSIVSVRRRSQTACQTIMDIGPVLNVVACMTGYRGYLRARGLFRHRECR